MIALFGIAIGAAILSLAWGLTARPSSARANLFAELPTMERPESSLSRAMRSLGRGALRVIPKPLIERPRNNLVLAGYPGGMDLGRLIGLKVTLALVPWLPARSRTRASTV